MALIKTIIQQDNFELIRNRIGEILVDEITEQIYLGNPNIEDEINVFIERIVPFDHTDLPAINVSLIDGSYDGYDSRNVDGEYNFAIDVYASAKSDINGGGDELAVVKLHKLMAIIRVILKSPFYLTLAFPRGSIGNTKITNMSFAQPKDSQDAESVVQGRFVFKVRAEESLKLASTFSSNGYLTRWELFSTDKGYQYFRY